MKKKRVGKAKRLSTDRISTLPQPILEIILSLLPTEEAARTSILSREWRYKWTKIPKLRIYHCNRQHTTSPRENMDMRCKNLYNIHKVLLLHQVPVHELTLDTCKDCDCFEFDRIVLHLAKNHTFQKLALYGFSYKYQFLPISIFSLHHITDLYLCCVNLEHQPVFNGFGSLRSLVLDDVGISTKTLLHLLSNCPSLQSFNLRIGETHFGEPCTVIELFKCLPVIEHLTTYRYAFWFWLHLGPPVPLELPSLLFHLKYFCFEQVSFGDRDALPFLLVLIKCSPNLEKIKVEIDSNDDCYLESPVVWEEYSNVWLEHLIELEIEYFSSLKPEMEFVKFILARSPKLKTVRIESVVDQDEESEMFKTLLRAPRASPVMIIVT